jgi:hypothetical protein
MTPQMIVYLLYGAAALILFAIVYIERKKR